MAQTQIYLKGNCIIYYIQWERPTSLAEPRECQT